MSTRGFLLLCMLTGLVLALSGVVRSGEQGLPADAIARVGEHLLYEQEYRRTINGIQAERRQPLDADARRRVLDRLVDEYLLLAYAQRENLVFEVPALRKRTVDQVLQLLREQAAVMEPEEQELLSLFRAHPAYFGVQDASDQHYRRLRPQILQEWRRRAAEQQLDALLQQLRDDVPLSIREDLI